MFNQLKSLLWLRKRVIKSNKTIILQILLPLEFAFLYKHIYEIQGSLNNSMKVSLLVNCLALSLSLSVGNPISTIVSEEKEKNILRTLFLSGVNSTNYILSVLFYPVLISLVMTTAIPRILELNIENNYGAYLIILLATSLVMMLINLFIGLISKTQVSAQVISLPVTMISVFIPMLSGISKGFDNVTKYSYMGLFSKSISQLETFKWQDQVASSLSLLVWLLLFTALTILQSKRLRKIS
ncbi:ABC transporter permease [Streptococcus salivarius]|uniref:ABC transporter permease n=1 Tax=Streptococcus salivarius TaxID=1304 RepID=UPI0034A554C8